MDRGEPNFFSSLATHYIFLLFPSFLFIVSTYTKMADEVYDGAIGIDLGTTYSYDAAVLGGFGFGS